MSEFDAAVDRALQDAVRIIRANDYRAGVLGEHLTRLLAALPRVRGITGAARSENPRATAGATLALAEALAECAAALEEDLAQRDASHAAAHAEHLARAEDVRHLERIVDELQERLHTTEALVATGSTVLPRLAAFVRSAVADMDGVLRRMIAVNERVERILMSEVEEIATLEQITVTRTEDGAPTREVRAIADETRALSVTVAPFRGRRPYDLQDADTRALDALTHRYDALRAQYDALVDIVDMVERDDGAIRQEIDALAQAWAEVDRNLRNALLLFPVISDEDCFALAGTSRNAIERQQRSYTELRQTIAGRLRTVEDALFRYRNQYTETRDVLAAIQHELERLGQHTDIAWFHALPEPAQRAIRAAVLTFQAKDRALSRRVIHAVLVHAGAIAVDAHEDLADVLHAELFAFGGRSTVHEHMALYRLTDAARFWREVWLREHTALAEQLAASRAVVASERAGAAAADEARRIARREERERKAAERIAAAAAAATERDNPVNILRRLDERSVAVLRVATDIATPADEQIDGMKIFAASISVGLIPAAMLRHIPVTLRNLLSFDPPLITTSHDDVRGGHCSVTDAARRLAPLFPSIPDAEAKRKQLDDLLRVKVKYWHERNRKCYEQLRKQFDLLPELID